MNKGVVTAIVAIGCLASCAASCIPQYEKVENDPYEAIYRVEDINAEIIFHQLFIRPLIGEKDEAFDAESRSFYSSVDTSLCFTGKVPYTAFNGGYRPVLSAVDWRISKMDVITLEDFDDAHPAGTSLIDLCELWYEYKHSYIIGPLKDVCITPLMLTDYDPWNKGQREILKLELHTSADKIPQRAEHPHYKRLDYDSKDLTNFPTVEVRITDTFGREFIKRVEQ